MAILKKPEPKKRACQCPPPVIGRSATGISALMSAGRTLAPTSEESAMRREMNKIQLATMKADLRKHVADADMAETLAKLEAFLLRQMVKQ